MNYCIFENLMIIYDHQLSDVLKKSEQSFFSVRKSAKKTNWKMTLAIF